MASRIRGLRPAGHSPAGNCDGAGSTDTRRHDPHWRKAMLRVGFAGVFPASLEQPVRRYLTTPCEIAVASEAGIGPLLPELDVLVTMGLSAEMGRAATRLKLVQVPG